MTVSLHKWSQTVGLVREPASVIGRRIGCIDKVGSFAGVVRQNSSLIAESPFYPPSVIKRSLRIPAPIQRALSWINRQLPHLDPKDLLPLGVELTTGAIIVGNPSTPNLLIAEFHSADGTFGIVPVWTFEYVLSPTSDIIIVSVKLRPVQAGSSSQVPDCARAIRSK